MNAPSRKPKSLYRELTIAMVVLVSLVLIAVNLFNYLYFAREAEATYQRKSSEYAVYLREALEWPLWNVDDELVGNICDAFASNAEIATLIVRDDQQRVVYRQEKRNGNQVKREVAIEHNGQRIGSIEIGVTLSAYAERDRQLLLASIATMVLLIAVLFAATRWILSSLLKKPVDVFIGATGDMVDGKYRQAELPETYVEFAPILSGFKTMSDAVASRESGLRQTNEHLAAEIAERKRAEEALRAASLYTRSLIESSLDPLVTISPEGKITDVNGATTKVTGLRREKLVGTDFSDYFTEPDRAREGYQQVFQKGFVTDYPLAIRHKDGGITDVLYNASVYRDETGAVQGVFAAARDVTERKQAEAERTQLAAIVESSNDAIIGKTPKGIITSWNKGAERIYGYAADEIIGKPITALAPPSRHAEIHELLKKVGKGGTVVNHESERIRKDGALIHVALTLSPIRDASGNITGISTIARDITEKKRMEEELQQASVYNRSLIEASLDPLVTISVEGKITDVNKATEEVTGRSRSELVGTDFSDYFTEPDKAREGYQQVFQDGFVTDYPLALRHRDGHITDVLYNASVYRNEAGEVLGVFAAARDISERKKTEESLRQMNERFSLATRAGRLGVWDWDLQKNELVWDDRMYELYGVKREDFATAYDAWLKGLHPDDRALSDEMSKQAQRGEREYDTEFRVVWPDSTVHHLKAYGQFVRDADGRPVRMTGVNYDITELKEAEDKITELNRDLERRVIERTEQLEAANKELEAFSYSVSHDLRSPLRAIDGFSRILLDDYAGKLDDEGRRLLNVVRDNTSRMGQLIDDILKFSRTGRLELTFSGIDMEGLAREVLEELRPAAWHELRVEIGHLPSTVGDRAMMRQVLVNLLSNAIKFTRTKEGARIEVGSSIAGNETVYFVRDNGAGFDMQYLDRLFGVFQRLHSVNEFEGTGIGLAIVKRIITRHGGRVWAEGKVNEGATIYFALPTNGSANG